MLNGMGRDKLELDLGGWLGAGWADELQRQDCQAGRTEEKMITTLQERDQLIVAQELLLRSVEDQEGSMT